MMWIGSRKAGRGWNFETGDSICGRDPWRFLEMKIRKGRSLDAVNPGKIKSNREQCGMKVNHDRDEAELRKEAEDFLDAE